MLWVWLAVAAAFVAIALTVGIPLTSGKRCACWKIAAGPARKRPETRH
jgi:heme exporter protein D